MFATLKAPTNQAEILQHPVVTQLCVRLEVDATPRAACTRCSMRRSIR